MLNRKLLLVASLLAALTLSAFAAEPGTDYLFQFVDPGSQSTRFVGYDATGNPMSTLIDAEGLDGIRRVLALPDGSGFYLVSDGPVQAVNADFTQFVNITGILGDVKRVKLTPDGSLLLILADQLYAVDTSTNAIVAHGFSINAVQTDFAISDDSTKAWVVIEAGFTSALVTVDLTTLKKSGDLVQLPLRGLGITTSPTGLIYISYAGRIDELNPETLQVTENGTYSLVAQNISPLRFTPDGQYAYFANLTPNAQGRTLQRLEVQERKISTWPSFSLGSTPPPFTDVVVAGNDRIFAFAASNHTLWDVMTNPLSADETSLKTLFPADQVLAVTASNEIPSSRFLYVLLDNGNQINLIRVDLSNNTTSANILAALPNGNFEFVAIPPQTGASTFIKTGDNQVLQPGATSNVIKIQVLDSLGRPVYNLPVTLSTVASSGLQLQDTSLITDANGYIRTRATVPETPGSYIINVNAVTANTTITLVVPEPGGGGGGGTPNGPAPIVIESGNGQLLEEFHASDAIPLVVRVQDSDGKPVSGAQVHFEVVDGDSFLQLYFDTYGSGGPGDTVTNADGLASAHPQPYQIPQYVSFAAATIRATTASGSVDFKLTVFRKPSSVPVPLIIRQKPAGLKISIGQGDILPQATQYHIYATAFPDEGAPIPFVGQRTMSPDPDKEPLAVCVNNTLSDNNGLSSCDLKAACINGEFRDYGLDLVIGWKEEQYTLSIGPGTNSMLTKQAGDGTMGRIGNQVGPLVAIVSDNCGMPKSGVVGTWEVISGDATVTNPTTSSLSSGKLQTNVVFGQIPGNVVVRLTVPNAEPVTFALTSQVVVSQLNVSSGSGQSALVNQPFANPIVFLLRDAANNPVQNTKVTFSVAGNGSVSSTEGTTNAQGLVQVNAIAGNAPGTLTVTAAVANLSATAQLTVLPPGPMLTSQDFFNAGSYKVGLVSCSLSTAKGDGIAPNVPGVISGVSAYNPLPFQLGGVSVQVNNIPAPIQSVVNQGGVQQVTFQTPCGLTGDTATVKVTSGTASTTVQGVPLFVSQPGVFTFEGAGGIEYAYVISAKDGQYVTPDNLARRGERYYLVLTGLGQTTPAIQTNVPGSLDTAQDVNLGILVGVGNRGMPVISARYVPGQIGVYTVEFEIPEIHPVGENQPFVIATQTPDGTVTFGNSVFLAGVK